LWKRKDNNKKSTKTKKSIKSKKWPTSKFKTKKHSKFFKIILNTRIKEMLLKGFLIIISSKNNKKSPILSKSKNKKLKNNALSNHKSIKIIF